MSSGTCDPNRIDLTAWGCVRGPQQNIEPWNSVTALLPITARRKACQKISGCRLPDQFDAGGSPPNDLVQSTESMRRRCGPGLDRTGPTGRLDLVLVTIHGTHSTPQHVLQCKKEMLGRTPYTADTPNVIAAARLVLACANGGYGAQFWKEVENLAATSHIFCMPRQSGSVRNRYREGTTPPRSIDPEWQK